ncbi:MAG: hypothetical protein C5S38_08565 [Candidatus Methanophagaceae archaeon]|nr:MAG: hypothetical protein C5S38_08565 [Methanophagales archaeon]KAF5431891.1 hypothetical protein C5S36_09635 [Methanophagales archaeon]
MRRHNILFPVVLFLGSIALGIFILFSAGSDLALTIIFIFLLTMIGAAFLVQYLVTVRKGSVREKVMTRDIEGVANQYVEQMRILHDFEDKYAISTKEFRVELEKVKGAFIELGCEVNGWVKIDRVKRRHVGFADVEWVTKMFEGIKEQHEVVLYSRMIDRCNIYLEELRTLEAAGYEDIRGDIEQIESKILADENLKKDSLELSMFMNELVYLLEEALRTCLHEAHGLEAEGREAANADTARVRTDLKLVEHSIENGNYENASKVLNGVIRRLSRMLETVFELYKEDTLALTTVVVEVLGEEEKDDKKKIEKLRETIEACMLPSQMRKLRESGEALVILAITVLEAIYNNIFDLEAAILNEDPTTDLYPVEYWSREKKKEVEDLKSIPLSDLKEFVRRYRLLASDAHSRFAYDTERLNYIKEK